MRDGERRALALPSEVPTLLAFDARTRPDGTGFLSVSAHGLWRCVGSREAFGRFRERVWGLGLREAIDFMPAPAGSDAVHHVDVVAAVMLVSGSHAESGRTAADFLDCLGRRLACAFPDFAAGAAVEDSRRPLPLARVRPSAPDFLDGRPLDVVRRVVGMQEVPVVSARQLHDVVSALAFAGWWRGMVRTLALDEGDDFRPVLPARASSADHCVPRKDHWLPLRVARKICSFASDAVRDPLVAHFRAWEAAEPLRPAWPAPSLVPASRDDPGPSEWHGVTGMFGTPSTPPIPFEPAVSMRLEDYLVSKGCDRLYAASIALEHERILGSCAMALGLGSVHTGLHPVSFRLVFSRWLLDGWWRAKGTGILAPSGTGPRH